MGRRSYDFLGLNLTKYSLFTCGQICLNSFIPSPTHPLKKVTVKLGYILVRSKV